MTFFAGLCGSCHRKPTASRTLSSRSRHSNGSIGNKSNKEAQEPEEQEERITELDAAIHGPIYPTIPEGSISKRRLSVCLSTGLKEGLSRIKTKKEKGGGDDSLWKKTIILGEKCKFPNEDGEEANNAVDSTGVSRNTSFASAETHS